MKNIQSSPSVSLQGKLQFADFNLPYLEAGEYKVNVSHKIANGSDIENTNYKAEFKFAVKGERFKLQPTEISKRFPHANDTGSFTNVLPHISLTRSTLPWERCAGKEVNDDTKKMSWLFLVLLTEEEMALIREQPVKVNELLAPSTTSPFWPGLSLDIGETATELVNTIDIPKNLLQSIIPSGDTLQYLSHVRFREDEQGNKIMTTDPITGEKEPLEDAFIVANRLPKAGETNYLRLVSVEGRFVKNNDRYVFDYQNNANDADLIRLLTIQSWQFSCVENSFSSFFENINEDTYRLPEKGHEADQYLNQSLVPLPHRFRNGQQSVSWYRGPLIGGNFTTPADKMTMLPIDADSLYQYNPDNGMFDVSYASAWQLGRFLALADKGFSEELYLWKKRIEEQQHVDSKKIKLAHLPLKVLTQEHDISVPNIIKNWFTDLLLLKNIPCNYLVADENLAPNESLRFFNVDEQWLQYLACGAFSIGFVNNNVQCFNLLNLKFTAMSGIILRTEAIHKFPLEINAYSTENDIDNKEGKDKPLKSLAHRDLSDDMRLYLFDEKLEMVDIYIKPEGFHFGFDVSSSNTFTKNLRNNQGEMSEKTVDVPLTDQNIVDIATLTQAINTAINTDNSSTLSTANFAMQMVEGSLVYRYYANMGDG